MRASPQSVRPSSSPAHPGEILALPQLDRSELEAVARLENACRRNDGGRLKLEWPTLRRREGGTTSDFVCLVSEEIVGFTGLYQWRRDEAEVCGMVHPDWRRRGIGSALLAAVTAEASSRGTPRLLMVVDAANPAGGAFARAHGGRHEYSELRMQQRRQPDHRDELTPCRVRAARDGDAAFIATCLTAAFEEKEGTLEQAAALTLLERTTVIEDAGGTPVGVMRVEREAAAASIYGFAVLPDRQRHGFGRAALTAVTSELHRSGVGIISLEVLASNEGALGLYRTCGFDVIGQEDYYFMPPEPAPAASL